MIFNVSLQSASLPARNLMTTGHWAPDHCMVQRGFQAQKLEKHELIEMRRIATLVWASARAVSRDPPSQCTGAMLGTPWNSQVYQKNKRYKQAIELAQQDKMYKEKADSF